MAAVFSADELVVLVAAVDRQLAEFGEVGREAIWWRGFGGFGRGNGMRMNCVMNWIGRIR